MADNTPPVTAGPETDNDDVSLDGRPLERSRLAFPVVGLGASAGGFSALMRFFENMPSDSGMAFVVVIHLSPRHASDLAGLLQGVTRMRVRQVSEPMPIEANHVYVIPPTKHLSMNDGRLELVAARRPAGRHVAIDLFFRSLAEVHRERAVAIVLSGTGSDGAVGIARVKEQGGVTLAQLPEDAEFDGMPTAAIESGMIDWTLPVVEMPAKLVEMWSNARRIELPPGAEGMPNVGTPGSAEAHRQAEDALHDIMVTLRVRTGHDFRHYKRATVLRRLERRLQVNGLPDLPSYRELLARDTPEAEALLRDLLISVTNFFRDREAFEALEREVIPALFDPAEPRESVRAWVAGCATGEEAYSVAMLLADEAAEAGSSAQVQVFASDIDERALGIARAGLYPSSIVTDVPPTRLRQYFNREGERYRVRKDVRERVLFTPHNLLRDPPFSRLDLVCCRNLLIYLDRDVQEEILHMFHFALSPGGFLFLGSSESADAASNLFVPVDKKHRIYRATAGRGGRRLPVLPMGAYPKRPQGGEVAAAGHGRPSYAEMHRRLIEEHAPPSVLIDAESNIVYLSQRAGRFLQYGAGTPSHNLLAAVRPEFRVQLRTALFQAAQSGQAVEARRVHLTDQDPPVCIAIRVSPAPPSALGTLTLVLFEELPDPIARPPTGGGGGDGDGDDADARDPLIGQLEAELRRTDAQLQITLEHSQTSTEELKASNEELQAINEELRSTTEELETSKEELQAINEELITVNQELKAKVDETAKINDDLQNLIASTDIATVFVDRAMRIKRYTPCATQLFNILPGDVGRSVLDITHRLTTDHLADDAAQAFQTLRTIEREVRDHGGRRYLSRALPYRTTEDRIDGAVLTFVDITARRDAEERLDAEEQRLRMVAESTRDYAIITFDTEGLVTTWNSGAERIFGHSRAQAIGQPGRFIFTPEDNAAGAAEEEMRQAREEGRAEDDRWHLRADGARIFCSGIMTPLRQDDELRGYAKIARDLTGSRRTEREREALLRKEIAARAQAIAAGELKDEFLAVMSHELKNPLNLIHLNAELLARLPEAKALPSVARAAEVIRKTVLSQAQIIDDLLDLSRANTGKLSLAREAVDWSVIVTTIVGALADEAVTQQVALSADLPPRPVTIEADPVRVEQIVWNLLSNALKFTPQGGEVSVRLREEGGYGVLEVRDNGRGIDPAHLPRLFGMFQQASSPTARHERGLGIGLAVVSQLARLHGGRVEGHSGGLGTGSTFTVWLPRHPLLLAGDRASRADEGVLPPGLRVLVIDDDRENTETLADLLRLEGSVVKTVFSADEALRAGEREDFDVIVSDIAMPGVDGYALIAALRDMPRTRRTPVVALTGFGRASDVRRAAEAGFDAHLRKPVTLEALSATLRRVLRPGAPSASQG